jgi:hypothetical protein
VLLSLRRAFLLDGLLHDQTIKLLAILAPMLVLAAFDWRIFLIAAGAVVPNLMGTIGGAEKINFYTHYHMPYLPFLISGAALGVIRLNAWLRRRASKTAGFATHRSVVEQGVLSVILLAVAAYSNWINPYNLSRTFVFDSPVDRSLVMALIPGIPNPGEESTKIGGDWNRRFVSSIPDGSTVASSEGMMPALVARRGMRTDYAPIGIGEDEYVILVSTPEGGTYKLQVASYLTGDELEKIRACVQERVDKYYNVVKRDEYSTVRFTIYKRK